MRQSDEIETAVDDIYQILRAMDGPRLAVIALLLAHVRITANALIDCSIDEMLVEYARHFREAWSERANETLQ